MRKKIGDRIFTREGFTGTKRSADRRADKLEKQGHSVRITSYKDLSEGKIYEIWKRKK